MEASFALTALQRQARRFLPKPAGATQQVEPRPMGTRSFGSCHRYPLALT